jgi:23S rRNA (uridine2552-2'-O)-methyltransferase
MVASKKKKNKFNQNWFHDHINDPYVKKAQNEGYRARAAYKLLQIDEDLKLIKKGDVIVDLGSCPGSWSQYVRRKLFDAKNNRLEGLIIAIDLLEMAPVANVHFMQGDFREEEVYDQLKTLIQTLNHKEKVDVVLSDMAPNLSGVAAVDAAQMENIAELVLEFAQTHLHPKGSVVMKLFHGSGYTQIVTLFKKHFKKVIAKKPPASRAQSSETFLIAQELQIKK